MAYVGYLHATQENKKGLYEAIDSEGHSHMKIKTSKWEVNSAGYYGWSYIKGSEIVK